MKFYIPPQISRLALAFAIVISLFLVIRHFLVPDTFGDLGHYRAESLKDNELHMMKYSGQQACFECHQDVEDKKSTDVHSDIHCETCHGPGAKHVTTGKAEDILKPADRQFCGVCHSLNAARQKNAVFQVDLSVHNVGKSCIECHNPHQPWEMKE
jgi:hypothetical protein